MSIEIRVAKVENNAELAADSPEGVPTFSALFPSFLMPHILLPRFSCSPRWTWRTPCQLASTLLSLLSLLSSCATDDPAKGTTLVEGQVVEKQSQRPVTGATVQVYQPGRGGGYGQVGGDYPTDASGHFSFRFEAESKSSYLIKATAPRGYFTQWGEAPDVAGGRKHKGLVVPMLAPAWAHIKIVDVPPKNRISMHISGFAGNGLQLYYPRDTTFSLPLVAGFAGKIIWIIREGGVDRQYSQDIRPAALDTVIVPITF